MEDTGHKPKLSKLCDILQFMTQNKLSKDDTVLEKMLSYLEEEACEFEPILNGITIHYNVCVALLQHA